MNKNNWQIFVFGAIILLGIVLRLYKFESPIADWHSWRQVDTSSVSRNFVQEGIDVLHPTYHDLSNVPSGLDNPQGYRFVEFPLFNVFQAGGYTLFNIFTLEQWGRLVSIMASVITTAMLYLLVKKHFNQNAALFSAFFFAVLPYSIYYGRTILPDQLMVAAIMSGIYFFDKWAEVRNQWLLYVLSLIFTAAALLVKPYALFFTLPLLYLAFHHFGFSMVKKWQLWVFLMLSVVPLIFWRVWMTQFPEGIPVSDWLFNAGGIRFKGSFFYWIFADRIARLILGYWGVILLLLGLLTLLKREYLSSLRRGKAYFIFTFLLASLSYIFVIAAGNVQHDYYQILIVPTLAMICGIGADFLTSLPKKQYSSFVGPLLLLVITFFTLMFGWYHVREYYNINNQAMLKAGKAVDSTTPKDAKVLANLGGDTTFLYQTNREGWSSYTYDMPKMIEIGADYLALVNPSVEEFERFDASYSAVLKTDEYVLFDLHAQK